MIYKIVTFILLNLYYKTKIINKVNYDINKKYLLVSNHTSNLDGLAVHLLFNKINVVGKKNICYAIEKDINYYINLCYKTAVVLQEIENSYRGELNTDIKDFISNTIDKLNSTFCTEDIKIISFELENIYNYYKKISNKKLRKIFKNLKKSSKMISINSLANKKSITWSKKPRIWGNALMNRGLIPVDRSNLLSAGRIITACVKKLEEGKSVAVFFQGTIKDLDKTTLDNIKGGASQIAYKSNTNVLPIYIKEFDYDKLTKHGRFPKIFSDYKIIIGEEIPLEETEKPTREQCNQLDEIILNTIKELKKSIV